MYRELSIWKRIDGKTAINFRCFEDIASHLFCVQSADFYTRPVTGNARAGFDRQSVELFIEVDPIERGEWFSTVEKAIAAHEGVFASMALDIVEQEKKQ
jgi:hypothetical protein